jgi:ribosomal-protein-alanine N-acetyltransferase
MPAIRRGDAANLASVAQIQLASPEAAHWRPEDYLAYDLLVADVEGKIAGFLVSRPLGSGEVEILNLAVAPEWRRRGIAKALIQTLLSESPSFIYLELRESNGAAFSLYKSLGFQQVSRRPGYYDYPPEAAIVMKFHSC